MNVFVRHHRELIRFGYGCFDRMLCNVFIQRFQFPPAMAAFLLHQRQAGRLTPEYFKAISSQYHSWLAQQTQACGVAIVQPPRDPQVRREQWVQPYFDPLRGGDGLAVILKSREHARVAVCYPSRNYLIEMAGRFIDVYYFYLRDPQLGRMFVRLAPYFPFNAQVCLNGHEWLARRLQEEGIAFVKKDNAFVECANPARLQELADALSPQIIQGAVDRVLEQWLPYFTPEERRDGYRHRVFMAQVEYCDNLIFHREAAVHRLFERLLDVNRSIGQPEQLAVVFGRPKFRADTRTGETLVKITPLRTPVLKSGFKSTFVKQYVKEKVLLRTETQTYQLRDLSLPKDIKNLGRIRQVFAQSNDRFLTAQQDVLASYVDRGQLAQLRQPSVSASGRRTPGLRLDDVRLLAVWQALTCFVHLAGRGDFRTSDLLDSVQRALDRPDYKLSQLRYDLGKLRAKGLVERLPGTQRYRLTSEGYRIGVLYCKLYHRLYAPLTAGVLLPVPADDKILRNRLTTLDRLYAALDQALSKLAQHVGLPTAA